MNQVTPTASMFCLGSHFGGNTWVPLDESAVSNGSKNDEAAEFSEKLREHLKLMLTSHRVMVLAGSGASIEAGAPSMGKLWKAVEALDSFGEVKSSTRYSGGQDVESLLSHCISSGPFLEPLDQDIVTMFVREAESRIYELCSKLDPAGAGIQNHISFLRKLTRRRSNLPRPKIITTNYDRCFEEASGRLALTVVDGFSYSQPRRFDPSFFGIDFVSQSHHDERKMELVDGVVHLLKIHGSVDWERSENTIIQRSEPDETRRCLIYPASTKYEHSYRQPYLEIMARFLTDLREPQTSLIVVGFGFNDDHLSAPILSALRSNHSLNVIVVSPSVKASDEGENLNPAWQALAEEARMDQSKVTILNATFSQFVELIPDLKALTPDQNLAQAIRRLGGNQGSD